MRRLILVVAALTVLSLAAGCSSGAKFTRKGPDYKQATTLPPLEVPPDLTSPVERGTTALPEIASTRSGSNAEAAGGGSRVLSEKSNVEVKGDGDQRWLLVDAAPEDVWNQVRDFWLKNGLELKIDEPSVGIMETQWAENRADVPEGFIRKWLGKVLDRAYSAPTRDKFRVRLKRTDNDKTELYLTHYGVEQVVIEQQVGGNDEAIWKRRPTDSELTQEMLNRVMVYLGIDAVEAENMLANAEQEQARAELVSTESEPQVLVHERFARAWRRTGIALDRIGFVVEDRDRSRGIYFVRYVDQLADAGEKAEKGWFSGLFSDEDDQSSLDGEKGRIVVRGDDRETRIVLRSTEGKSVDSQRASTILNRLAQQLR